MEAPEVGAVVVGAGIAGLAAALELQRSTREVVVIDAGDRPGGVMRTDHVSGYVIERGPNTVQAKAPLRGLVERFGLESDLVRARPASRQRFVLHAGHLERVPLSPPALLRTPLLSARGKLRLLIEPLVRRGDGRGESVSEFASRRLGREVVERLLGPFLTGVYAGDERELGAEAVFGSLVEHERRWGSIAMGALASALRRGRPRGWSGSWGAGEGFGPFARHLSERLIEAPALKSRVRALRPDGAGWRVELGGEGGEGGESALRSSRVVLATPAREAAEVLRGGDAEVAAALDAIEYAPIVGLALGAEPHESIEGFGFLVPRDADLSLLGCLFMSRLFPSRAPAGRELLQCLLGGRRWPQALACSDDELHARVSEDLARVLGLASEPQRLAVTRWPRAIPQPDRHHTARIAEVRRRLAERGGLALAGAYLDGVSVGDALASGLRAARELDPTLEPA